MSTSAERQVRLELAWWAWHDADADRWSASTEEAEERCAAWVRGESDDGPPPVDPEDDAACIAEART